MTVSRNRLTTRVKKFSRYVIDVQFNRDNDKIKSRGLGVEYYEQACAKFASSFHVKNAQKHVREH